MNQYVKEKITKYIDKENDKMRIQYESDRERLKEMKENRKQNMKEIESMY